MVCSCKSISILLTLLYWLDFINAFCNVYQLKQDRNTQFGLSASTEDRIKLESKPIALPERSDDYKWDLGKVAFSLLPLAAGDRRRTLFEEIVRDRIWTLDQIQGIINVNVPVRAVIVKLSGGGLFIYNPVAPTMECLKIVRDLESKHGKVRHIVLGSLGLEHKSMAGPFSRYFPDSTVWLQPGQWSFPINLPTSLFGFPSGNRLKEIPAENIGAPWEEDFDHCTLGPLRFKSVGMLWCQIIIFDFVYLMSMFAN